MKQFIKKDELQLINGGYLSTKKDETPISNTAFVQAQKHAAYVMTFAKMAKGKDFKGTEAYSLNEFKSEVHEAMYEKQIKEFVSSPKKPTQTLNNKLKAEALAFIDFDKNTDKVTKINTFLAKFAVIAEFEEFGLFFEQDIVKLDEIYTMKQIINAVTEVIDLID